MSAISRSGAQTVVTACPGCLLHLKAGAHRHHLPVQVVHISKLMAGTAHSAPILVARGEDANSEVPLSRSVE
jgi:hypothetical protein